MNDFLLYAQGQGAGSWVIAALVARLDPCTPLDFCSLERSSRPWVLLSTIY